MEKRVSKAVFKSKACELFRHVEMLGETVVVTDRGEPTVEIRPYRSRRKNPLELLRSSIVHFSLKGGAEALAQQAENG
ncbi:type II toxin-antitoxin system Phd/YefM family antitoxin [Paraburkholderia dinghuensis]|uniref:Type II toxin-antitoxin system Phd/YefM family antitoxin n=1 Tax=Paraburkholderia dinghuensis TaxID=2305225 RepID=A0A3N6MTH3_9BURK|nr:type II toxin-antitoxin system Phd/YefM family antitoxin [Paraburkholderia dinghuensis]RQH06999.1 type II toxin-antitoxin system Phd/YefM family antitoxin [Paraburkholderia dinghuensis]